MASAVFKTVVGSFHEPGYVRFVPSPPAFPLQPQLEASERAASGCRGEEVIAMSREQILKLTSLSSCAG